jgi:hypothetical protein
VGKAKLMVFLCTLTAAAWSLPGFMIGSWFDGH